MDPKSPKGKDEKVHNIVVIVKWDSFLQQLVPVYSHFEKGCWKNCARENPKGNMGYDQYTVPDTVGVEPSFVAFF